MLVFQSVYLLQASLDLSVILVFVLLEWVFHLWEVSLWPILKSWHIHLMVSMKEKFKNRTL